VNRSAVYSHLVDVVLDLRLRGWQGITVRGAGVDPRRTLVCRGDGLG